ncbi:hypothetical protein [Hirschia maritima]|uniref:hypothetical protein n=1 Tax=Hirschia maritima TaxID=1121961 RepID=UPI0003707FED|nr:hypothetical protein [Hirschia maritima]
MSVLKIAGIVSLGVLVTGCINVQTGSRGHGDFNYYDAASVKGVSVQNGEIAVTVSSNGCTDKDFIDAEVEKDGRSHFEVEFERVRTDHCKAYKPDGVTLVYTFQELGIPAGSTVEIENQVRG